MEGKQAIKIVVCEHVEVGHPAEWHLVDADHNEYTVRYRWNLLTVEQDGVNTMLDIENKNPAKANAPMSTIKMARLLQKTFRIFDFSACDFRKT